jgi:hypothetical protein
VAFYVALAHAPIVSLICQNAPAILTEPAYHQALSTIMGLGHGQGVGGGSCFRCSDH